MLRKVRNSPIDSEAGIKLRLTCFIQYNLKPEVGKHFAASASKDNPILSFPTASIIFILKLSHTIPVSGFTYNILNCSWKGHFLFLPQQ